MYKYAKAMGFRFAIDDLYMTGVRAADFDKYKSYGAVCALVAEPMTSSSQILDGALSVLRKEALLNG